MRVPCTEAPVGLELWCEGLRVLAVVHVVRVHLLTQRRAGGLMSHVKVVSHMASHMTNHMASYVASHKSSHVTNHMVSYVASHMAGHVSIE